MSVRYGVAAASGIIFGFGLALSGMLNPARIRGFLDISGAWDPSLVFVLGGAVVVAFIGVRIARRMAHPVFDTAFHLATTAKIDTPLVLGSALFGVGWGLGGFCPGPAVAALSLGLWQPWAFVVAMVVGMTLHDRLVARRPA